MKFSFLPKCFTDNEIFAKTAPAMGKTWQMAGYIFLVALVFALPSDREIMDYIYFSGIPDMAIVKLARESGAIEVIALALLLAWVIRFLYSLYETKAPSPALRAIKPFQRRIGFIITQILVSTLVVHILKVGLGRPRPEYAFENDVFGLQFFELSSQLNAFPSGHTAAQMAVIFSLAFFFPRFKLPIILFGLVWVSANCLAFNHWPSDILGAVAVALLSFSIVRIYSPKVQ